MTDAQAIGSMSAFAAIASSCDRIWENAMREYEADAPAGHGAYAEVFGGLAASIRRAMTTEAAERAMMLSAAEMQAVTQCILKARAAEEHLLELAADQTDNPEAAGLYKVAARGAITARMMIQQMPAPPKGNAVLYLMQTAEVSALEVARDLVEAALLSGADPLATIDGMIEAAEVERAKA